jgi:hypothetical protein
MHHSHTYFRSFVLLGASMAAAHLVACSSPVIINAPADPVTDSGTAPGDTATTTTPPVDTGTSADTTPPPPTDSSTCKPVKGTCNSVPQCGCGAGENCDFVASGSDWVPSCISAGGASLDDACTKSSDCAKGFSCVGTLCRPFCATKADCTGDASGLCLNVKSGGTTSVDIPGYHVCFAVGCNPMKPLGKCGTQGCGFLDDTTTICERAGAATTAGSCASDSFACAPGYVCSSVGDCRKWCRVGFDSEDCGGKLCQGLTSTYTFESRTLGLCQY